MKRGRGHGPHRVLLLLGILAGVAVGVAGVCVLLLHDSSVDQHRRA